MSSKRPGIFRIAVMAALTLSGFARSDEPFEQMRDKVRESCARQKHWKATIRLKGLPLDVGTIVWSCPASFRLEYGGPGAFEYASNGVEAWIGRPSFSAKRAEIEHHWRLSGTDLETALAFLRGEDDKLAVLKANFKASSTSSFGAWGVKLTPFRATTFASIAFEWKMASGQLSGVRWTGPEGITLVFEVSPPEALDAKSPSSEVVPRIAKDARVTRFPGVKKR